MNKRALATIKIVSGVIVGIAAGFAVTAAADTRSADFNSEAPVEHQPVVASTEPVAEPDVAGAPGAPSTPAPSASSPGQEPGQTANPSAPAPNDDPAAPSEVTEPPVDQPAEPQAAPRATTIRTVVGSDISYVPTDRPDRQEAVCTYRFSDGSTEVRLVGSTYTSCPAL